MNISLTRPRSRGLGYSSVVRPRFFQAGVMDGDFLVLAQDIPRNCWRSERLTADPDVLGMYLPFSGEVEVLRMTYGEGLSLKAHLEARSVAAIPEEPAEESLRNLENLNRRNQSGSKKSPKPLIPRKKTLLGGGYLQGACL